MGQSNSNDLSDYGSLPVEVVIAQTQRMRREMAEAGETFVKEFLERFEACARNVRNCSIQAERAMFQPFFEAMFKGLYIRIVGTRDENQVYELTGIDGDGMWFRKYGIPNSKEFHVSVSEKPDVASRIRIVKDPEYWRRRQISSVSDNSAVSPETSPSSSSSSSSSPSE